jgi:hypothetical protein
VLPVALTKHLVDTALSTRANAGSGHGSGLAAGFTTFARWLGIEPAYRRAAYKNSLVGRGHMASAGIGGVVGGAWGEVGLLFDGALLDIVDDAWRTDTLPNDGARPPLAACVASEQRG